MRISDADIAKAEQMDLLTYLQIYEPGNLKRVAGNEYRTIDHDSLRISNGKWHWYSKGIGGYNALQYLMKVREMKFPDAVRQRNTRAFFQRNRRKRKKNFLRPPETTITIK